MSETPQHRGPRGEVDKETLKRLHDQKLREVHHLRKLLNLPPLLAANQQRQEKQSQ